jgi:hypothetical protein
MSMGSDEHGRGDGSRADANDLPPEHPGAL